MDRPSSRNRQVCQHHDSGNEERREGNAEGGGKKFVGFGYRPEA